MMACHYFKMSTSNYVGFHVNHQRSAILGASLVANLESIRSIVCRYYHSEILVFCVKIAYLRRYFCCVCACTK